ncbi:MAG: hypothetical protein IKX24_07215 [Prevotella sp.]|nr:hypothetical protein [Prevotella sp.]
MAEKEITNKQMPGINCDYRVKLYEDGKYHWMYDLHLLKNPSVLFDLFKALVLSVVIVAILFFIIQACSNGIHLEEIQFVLKVTGIMAGIMLVLGLLGYFIYAAMSGWAYSVHFIMDENGVTQEQAPRAQKVSERVGCLTVLVGLLTRKPGVMGTGMIAASRTSMRSDFSSVRKVKAMRWMNTIKVNERFGKNRVYANNDDFDFVYNYISSRCPKAKVS